jgi:hypothetical protein
MRPVLIALVAATAASLIYGTVVESPAVTYYVAVTAFLVGAVGLIHRSVRFSDITLWALAVAAIGNLAGGVLIVGDAPLYELSLIGSIRYDKLFHTVATGIGAWASLEALETWTGSRRPALVFAAVMMASGAGALVEVVEYIGTLLRENTVVGGYTNNMQDLIANTLGALIGAGAAFYRQVADQRPG